MAAGDTMSGQIQTVAEFVSGDRPVVMGELASGDVDTFDDSNEEKLYVNTASSRMRSKPSGARSIQAPRLAGDGLGPGEKFEVQHKSDDLEEAIDVDAGGAFSIDVVILDLNRGRPKTRTLTAVDNALSANPTSSKSEFVTFFEFEVPSEQRLVVAGSFEIAAVENA